jgi:hypothetical protein
MRRGERRGGPLLLLAPYDDFKARPRSNLRVPSQAERKEWSRRPAMISDRSQTRRLDALSGALHEPVEAPARRRGRLLTVV